jgi:hypothetical protein
LATLMVLAGLLIALGNNQTFSAYAAGLLLGCMGLLVGDSTGPAIGLATALSGIAAAAIIWLGRPHLNSSPAFSPSGDNGPFFRLLVAATSVVLAFGLSQTLPLQTSASLNFAWYWLAVLALVLLMTERHLAGGGFGLLLFGTAGPAFFLTVSSEHQVEAAVAGSVLTIALGFLVPALSGGSGPAAPTSPAPKAAAT